MCLTFICKCRTVEIISKKNHDCIKIISMQATNIQRFWNILKDSWITFVLFLCKCVSVRYEQGSNLDINGNLGWHCRNDENPSWTSLFRYHCGFLKLWTLCLYQDWCVGAMYQAGLRVIKRYLRINEFRRCSVHTTL